MVCSWEFLTIEKVIPGGLGLARLANGLVVMVPYVLPGEKVKVEISQKKKGYARAALLEVIDPSQHRVTPPCPYYGKCGGCDFQHISYPYQLEIKQDLLKHQLQHAVSDSIEQVNLQFDSLLGAKNHFNYRQRIKLQVERGKLGFFKHGSHQIVEVTKCLLADSQINELLQNLRKNKQFAVLLKNSSAVEIKLSPEDQNVILLISFLRKPRPNDILAANTLVKEIEGLKSLFFQTEKWGNAGPFFDKDYFDEKNSALINFKISVESDLLDISVEAGGFCQVNFEQNNLLIRHLLEWSKIGKEDSVLDLFCGMGNFSIPASIYAGSVKGTDLQRSAIRSANRNARLNSFENCNFQQKSAVNSASEMADGGLSFDLVIIDPPRQGCRDVIPYLKTIAKSKIVYISCDPATLSRDLADITNCGYKICRVRGIDMFPQTHHLETIVLLDKVVKQT